MQATGGARGGRINGKDETSKDITEQEDAVITQSSPLNSKSYEELRKMVIQLKKENHLLKKNQDEQRRDFSEDKTEAQDDKGKCPICHKSWKNLANHLRRKDHQLELRELHVVQKLPTPLRRKYEHHIR